MKGLEQIKADEEAIEARRVREEAILICAIAACEPRDGGTIYDVADGLGINLLQDDASTDLAVSAWCRAHVLSRRVMTYEQYCAEAECMLREGWAP